MLLIMFQINDRQKDQQTSDCPIWDTSIVVLASLFCRVSINSEIPLTDRQTDRMAKSYLQRALIYIIVIFYILFFSKARYTYTWQNYCSVRLRITETVELLSQL